MTSTLLRSAKAAATAPPVSPEVATIIVRRPDMRATHAARKRAPTSLNAAVGPWKSSSTAVSLLRKFSVTGKLNASSQMSER